MMPHSSCGCDWLQQLLGSCAVHGCECTYSGVGLSNLTVSMEVDELTVVVAVDVMYTHRPEVDGTACTDEFRIDELLAATAAA